MLWLCVLVICSLWTDWALLAPVFTMLFAMHMGTGKSITGIWKSSGTLLSVECVVIQDGLRAGECAHTFCMCLYRAGSIGSGYTVYV